ncbi:MAG: signal peptide peptidase SppA [bacterium]
MKERSWVMIIIIAVVIAGAVSFLLLLYVGALLPGGQSLAFGEKIGLIRVEGAIYNSRPAVDEIVEFGKDDDIKALLVRIDSPGGGVAASQEIYEELKKVSDQGKPVIASMGSLAASGGYYVACGADTIVANPGTLTGSIGVIMRFAQAEELLRKIGVGYEVVKTGEYKDIGSPSRPLTEEERLLLTDLLDDVYDQFVSVIVSERDLERSYVESFSDGRLLTGRQAFEMGLVDSLGDLHDAIMLAGKMAGIDGEPVIVRPRRKTLSLWDVLSDLAGKASTASRSSMALEYSFR